MRSEGELIFVRGLFEVSVSERVPQKKIGLTRTKH